METKYTRWGIKNSNDRFLSNDDEGFYYYQPFDAEFLFTTREIAEDYLKQMQEFFKDVKKGEKMNMYSDCEYDPDMEIVEVEVYLKTKK